MSGRGAAWRDAARGLPWWRLLGVAGLVGVAATGVAVTRAERRRRAYTPDEIRARLHARAAAAGAPHE